MKIVEELCANEMEDYASINGGDRSGLEDFSNGFFAGFEAAEDHYGVIGASVDSGGSEGASFDVKARMRSELARAQQKWDYGERLIALMRQELGRVESAMVRADDYQRGVIHGLNKALTELMIEQNNTNRSIKSFESQLERNFNERA